MWIIIEMQHESDLPISELDGFVVLNEDGNVAIFSDRDAAISFQDENIIDGQIIELPVY